MLVKFVFIFFVIEATFLQQNASLREMLTYDRFPSSLTVL